MKRHVLGSQLPWFWAGTSSCWQCKRPESTSLSLSVKHGQTDGADGGGFDDEHLSEWAEFINGSLHLMRCWLGFDKLQDLLEFTVTNNICAKNGVLSATEEAHMKYYMLNYSEEHVTSFRLCPPKHMICLSYWQIISGLLNCLLPEQREEFRTHEWRLTADGFHPVPSDFIAGEGDAFTFVDSHFHLDKMLSRVRKTSWRELKHILPKGGVLDFAVANDVFPDHWGRWMEQTDNAGDLAVTFGIHPHVTARGVRSRTYDRLQSLIEDPICCR